MRPCKCQVYGRIEAVYVAAGTGGCEMIDEKNLLDWLQDEYNKTANDERNESNYFIYYQNYGKISFMQDILIEIKQGRFNGN